MLSRKDKEWIEGTLTRIVYDALAVEVTMEKRRDPATGAPLAVPEVVKKRYHFPQFWGDNIHFLEGAIRGNQATLDKVTNEVARHGESIGAMARIIIGCERAVKRIISGRPLELARDEMKEVGNGS